MRYPIQRVVSRRAAICAPDGRVEVHPVANGKPPHMTRIKIALVLLSGMLAALRQPLLAGPKIESAEVGPTGEKVEYIVSPRGVHLASVAPKGSRVNVLVDGVAGPKFDEILLPTLWIDPRPYAGISDPNRVPRPGRVIFSRDGRRFAYVARLSHEWVLMADDKEVLRIPAAGSVGAATGIAGMEGNTEIRMEFTGEDGKHLLFSRSVYGGIELWFDGQKWPGLYQSGGGGSAGTVDPLISPDGEHVAYTAQVARDKRALFLDGKEAGYYGDRLQFTGDSKHLVCLSQSPKGQSVLIDGKAAFSAKELMDYYLSPVGTRLILVLTRPGNDGSQAGTYLVVDGKAVEASLTQGGIKSVVFSPDGRHYAAICGSSPNQFVLIDGKKGQEYFNIATTEIQGLTNGLTFSSDSGRVAYIASSNSGQFVVIGDDESDALQNPWFMFSPDGKRVAYGGMVGQGGQKWLLSIDGRKVPLDLGWNITAFAFSPDSSRYAFATNQGGNTDIVLDGKSTGLAGKFAFSSDSKHLLVSGSRPPPEKRNAGIMGNLMGSGEGGLFVDGQLVSHDSGLCNCVVTPDGGHIYWNTTEPATDPNASPGTYESVIYLDGNPALRTDRVTIGSGAFAANTSGSIAVQFVELPRAWNLGTDGTLTLLTPVGDGIRRFTITPGAESSVQTMIAEAAQAPARAAAAAAEAKKKIEEAAAAKKAKADSDAAAAAAKAKADYDAAVAANVKARADAVAKAKADYEARLAKQKADYDAAVAKRKADYDAAVAKKKADYDAAVAKKKAEADAAIAARNQQSTQ